MWITVCVQPKDCSGNALCTPIVAADILFKKKKKAGGRTGHIEPIAQHQHLSIAKPKAVIALQLNLSKLKLWCILSIHRQNCRSFPPANILR